MPRPLHDRDGVSSTIWKQINPSQFIVAVFPTTHSSAPPLSGVVRTDNFRAFRLTRLSDEVITCDLAFQSDLKGHIPLAVTKAVMFNGSLSSLWRAQLCFANLKEYDSLDDRGEDARLLAQLMMDTWGSAKKDAGKRKALLTFFARSAILRHITKRYPWLFELISTILRNKLRPPSANSTPLQSFTNDDARKVGRSFASILLGSATHDAAVDEYIMS